MLEAYKTTGSSTIHVQDSGPPSMKASSIAKTSKPSLSKGPQAAQLPGLQDNIASGSKTNHLSFNPPVSEEDALLALLAPHTAHLDEKTSEPTLNDESFFATIQSHFSDMARVQNEKLQGKLNQELPKIGGLIGLGTFKQTDIGLGSLRQTEANTSPNSASTS
eukprot:gene26038-11733_t